ncbi:uncharacterized protein A4U43_C05F3650 [Asparagus officinalis]|uniref:Symplekin C-terminal domain-containing protein n=1 Tax=Asparagus officinalis TaxID=4686 RepID=A0A5P1EPB5_ASPOF|nr:uncharacterized protein A4U43_C05F3650 [Asparagus officinalis]
MKHLPKSLPVSPGRTINIPPNSQTSFPSTSQAGSSVPNTASSQSSPLPSVLVSAAVSSNGINTQAYDIPSVPNLVNDVKRDPRRDPRRLDPRRSAAPVGESSTPLKSVGINDIQGLLDSSNRPTTSGAQTTNLGVQTIESAPTSNAVLEFSEKLIDQAAEQQISGDNLESINEIVEKDSSLEGQLPSDLVLSPVHSVEQESTTSLEISENEGDYDNMLEPDMTLSSEDVSHDLPMAPLYVEQTNEQKKALCQLAMTRLIDYKQIQTSGRSPSCLSILARLVAQSDADDDLVTFFRKHIVLDYHRREGHDLSMHVLYHLYAVTVSNLDGHSPLETNNYEKFLLAVAKALLDSLPASDKSFSRLLGEAPFLTESAFKMLEDLCQSHGYENHKDACDGDRVSQGLGALWSLILGRPVYRQTCLDIALKCSVHSHDEVRAKAIRLVANKLFLLPYASERIEKFAQSMLFSVVDQHVSEAETQHPASSEQMKETGIQETSVSHAHNSDIRPSESETIKDKPLSPHSVPTTPLLHAQRQTSLFFALCTKKPSLLHLVFDVYGRAPKVVRQSIHRHIPGLIRTLGPSDPKLLQMISEPPEGSENLITLVLQLMTEESTPSADLIASVKHLYDTKLKDVTILIPLLSSLSKDEVLPIFPRLVNLPLEKFQDALARILQGSAHTGPALTPVEVLVAIHDVDPVKHGVALKKITDACTACFEQRTVFTQHVLAKSLSHMVEQVPLPMLLFETVIQAIGAYPVPSIDFVMGILSKLVEKQIWKMPKLWVGFLKLVSQTHPHSFNVLLQLPPLQLENALNKYANLRSPLAAYADQPNIRTSLSRYFTL